MHQAEGELETHKVPGFACKPARLQVFWIAHCDSVDR